MPIWQARRRGRVWRPGSLARNVIGMTAIAIVKTVTLQPAWPHGDAPHLIYLHGGATCKVRPGFG